MTEITAAEFKKVLATNGPFSSLQVKERIDVDSSDTLAAQLQLDGCNIKALVLKDIKLDKIQFSNMAVEELILRGNCDIGELKLLHATKVKLIHIERLVHVKSMHIDVREKIDTVSIEDSVVEQLYCEETSINYAEFWTREAECNFNFNRSVSFNTLTLSGKMSGTLRDVTAHVIEIGEITGNGIEVYNTNVHEHLKLTNAKFEYFLIQTDFLKKLILDNVAIETISLSEQRQHGAIEIIRSFEGWINVGRSSSESVLNLRLENAVVANGSVVSFKELHNLIFAMESTENLGTINLVNNSIDSMLVVNSNCGSINIRGGTIKQKSMTIVRSSVSKVKLYDHNWDKLNDAFERQSHHFLDIREFLVNRREIFTQLKDGMLKNNNKYEAIHFQELESRTHYQLLRKKIFDKPDPLRNVFDFLIHGTHKAASDFSQSIWKPFVFLLIFHGVLVSALVLHNEKLNIDFNWCYDHEATSRAFSVFVQTILPTHYSEVNVDLGKIYIGGIWDLLIRISSAYFIFYFITASRKFHNN